MKQMLKPFVLAACTIIYSATSAQQLNKSSFLKAPESVIPYGPSLFITDLGEGGKPTVKDGNGIIWKMDPQGQGHAFATGLDAPKGTAIIGHTLYVADIDKVKGFDINSGKQVFSVDFAATKTSLLNDLVVKDDSTLFVSSTDINKIYVVHLSGNGRFEELPLTSEIRGANGLAYDVKRQRLYVCGLGSLTTFDGDLGYIDLHKTPLTFVHIGSRKGLYDGLALTDNNRKLVVSDWISFEKKGVILLVDIESGDIQQISQAPLNGPADFALYNNKLIIPLMLDAAVIAMPLHP
ncbi:SMP-30/gluconolactonase/LRE family protein [Chitinophaga sp. Cy-1792]|uniref:SMP-30/gluconolactonase/LRE family protein n=1 Tax=Chitinophaga sp. Cy-1792 TaxID=2608339 RepID=UPI00141EC465|nr:hypothetical protein [Chitinophaga sp. Cy-1792]NIG57404.1 hypothetical protein [Chitinophaga sp. Cy-1792]